MAEPVDPPELAALLDFSERPRNGDWSLRSALTRYAQPEPERVSGVLELVRRAEAALKPHAKLFAKQGEAVWAAVSASDDGDVGDGIDPVVVGVLRAVAELDRLGGVLAEWAVDRAGPRPDDAVDAATSAVAARLDELGVAREERVAPRGARSRG